MGHESSTMLTPAQVLCNTCRIHEETCYTVLPSCDECPLRKELLRFDAVIAPSIN
jgi:hypothetical protein